MEINSTHFDLIRNSCAIIPKNRYRKSGNIYNDRLEIVRGLGDRMDTLFSFMIPLLISMAAGFIMGYFNQYVGNEGGPRTFALVTIGSTLVTLVSIYFFNNSDQPWLADPARISAAIVAALSFLGTGLIWLSEEQRNNGLSSATNLWVAALFGMMLGSGSGFTTMLVFCIIILVFIVLNNIERRLNARKLKSLDNSREEME